MLNQDIIGELYKNNQIINRLFMAVDQLESFVKKNNIENTHLLADIEDLKDKQRQLISLNYQIIAKLNDYPSTQYAKTLFER